MLFFQAEVRANKGKKIDDPFTRRHTKPRMVTKLHEESGEMGVDKGNSASKLGPDEERLAIEAAMNLGPPKRQDDRKSSPAPDSSKPIIKTDDLFSAHDFDITIDLEVPLASKFLYTVHNNGDFIKIVFQK